MYILFLFLFCLCDILMNINDTYMYIVSLIMDICNCGIINFV